MITIYPGLLAAMYAFSKRKDEVSRQELQEAVHEALANADDETKQKLAKAAEKAKKDKERAVDTAVKKAVRRRWPSSRRRRGTHERREHHGSGPRAAAG